ncbi:hypothetical protein GGR53DRAFT_37813 [Hypoxylon sp. FL1150]|nr:hypothetical protein GGR53DRAFT_37813 [Hypoxylon sp. FL1150]
MIADLCRADNTGCPHALHITPTRCLAVAASPVTCQKTELKLPETRLSARHMPPGDHAFLFEPRRTPRAPQRAVSGSDRGGGSLEGPASLDDGLHAPLPRLSELKSCAVTSCRRLGRYVSPSGILGTRFTSQSSSRDPRPHGRAPPLRLRDRSPNYFAGKPLTLSKVLADLAIRQGSRDSKKRGDREGKYYSVSHFPTVA